MTEVMIWDPIERFFWAIAIGLLFLNGIIFLKKAKQSEHPNDRLVLFGFATNFFCFAITRIFFYISDLQFLGYYENNTFYSDMNHISEFSQILDRIGYIFGLSGFVLLLLTCELTIKKTKYMISIINAFFLILHFLFPYNITRTINLISTLFTAISFLFALLYFTERAERDLKAISAFMLCGYCLILTASILYGNDVKSVNSVPLSLGPIIMIIGTLIYLVPIYINPKRFSNVRLYWTGFSILVILVQILMSVVAILYNLSFAYFIAGIIIIFVISYLFFKISRILEVQGGPEGTSKGPNILGTLARPQKITEEEVSISKEKKICLVCKNKISREIYMCPTCFSFYCIKCSKILANLENACWNCNAPFDETKPVKLTEQEEASINIVEGDHKKIPQLK